MSAEPQRCTACGSFEAAAVGDRWLCDNCRSSCACCCPEFGREEEESNPEGA